MKNRLQLILKQLDDINYGFVDNGHNVYPDTEKNWDKNFGKLYHLQSPEDLLKTGYGVCWDQVELERFYLTKNDIKSKSYFIIAYDGKQEPTHTFVVVKSDKYYWLEHSWEPYRGVHEYDTLEKLLNDVKNKFIHSIEKQHVEDFEIAIYEYDKPKDGLNCVDFMEHCENGKKIDISR